jgi:hypothetical protein
MRSLATVLVRARNARRGAKRLLATLAALTAATPACANFLQQPGELTGLNVYAPLPDGAYFVNQGSWGVRDTMGGSGPNTGLGVDIPAIAISTPLYFLGGKVEFIVGQPVVDVSVDHTTSLYGFYYLFVQPVLTWDLGNGFSIGGGVGGHFPTGAKQVEDATMGRVIGVRPNFGVYYNSDIWTLGITGSYLKVEGNDHTFAHNDYAAVDITAFRSFGKWQAGLVAFGYLDTTPASIPGAYGFQGQFALGPMVGYNFGPVIMQARLTRDVVEQHLGGFETRFWTGIVIPLGNPFGSPPAAPPGALPPAAAVPPPVAPARTYLVFFDWDRADLTTRARQIVAEAAQASTHVAVTRIDVNGYTDSSGSPAYNLKLSQRRADSVAKELVSDGVQRSEIDIHGYGETHPLVPTADGVREPQNRRVEIIF